MNEYYKDPTAREQKKRKAHEYRLMRRYGLTLEEKKALLDATNWKCPICQIKFSEDYTDDLRWQKDKSLNNVPVIDHCHSTGKVRGILCRDCNIAIGLLKESMESLESAVQYLKGHK